MKQDTNQQITIQLIANLKQKIKQIVEQTTKSTLNLDDVHLEHPAEPKHGDLSTNIALTHFKKLTKSQKSIIKSPKSLANLIAEKLDDTILEINKITIADPGFINFTLKSDFYLKNLELILNNQTSFADLNLGQNKLKMVEYAHPNTHKSFHIGHLRNIAIGEAIARIIHKYGYQVIRANYQGDVGLHIAKCLHGIISQTNYQKQLSNLNNLSDKVNYLAQAYVRGTKLYEESKKAKQKTHDINYMIYASAQQYQLRTNNIQPSSTDYLQFVKDDQQFSQINKLWQKTRRWSLDYFETIYKRVHTKFDKYYFESQCLAGVDLAKQALEKGILKKSNKAVIFDGSKYNLDTRVFINSLGLPTYEGKELQLAHHQLNDFPNLDKIIHVVAPEQTSFFDITFKVEELMNEKKFKNKQHHLKYGYVQLKKGKMSSRTGNIVTGKWLLDQAKHTIQKQFNHLTAKQADEIALAAVKYSLLKINAKLNITFDFDESISINGNSGPYLQYTYARTKSILDKAQQINKPLKNIAITDYEKNLLQILYQYPESIVKATEELSPHHICNYLFELAQSYNSFYRNCPIIKAKKTDSKTLRLALTQATSTIIQSGLNLLGINTVEKM